MCLQRLTTKLCGELSCEGRVSGGSDGGAFSESQFADFPVAMMIKTSQLVLQPPTESSFLKPGGGFVS